MDLFSIIVILLLGFIAYQQYTQKPAEKSVVKSNLRGTFSGAFSEAEIEQQQQKDLKLQEQVSLSFDQVRAIEKKEISAHAQNGGTKESFMPSQKLIAAITSMDFALDNRQANAEFASKMIEANAAVLTGKSIKDAQSDVWKHRPQLRVFAAALARNGSTYKKALEERKDYWKNCWDSIVVES